MSRTTSQSRCDEFDAHCQKQASWLSMTVVRTVRRTLRNVVAKSSARSRSCAASRSPDWAVLSRRIPLGQPADSMHAWRWTPTSPTESLPFLIAPLSEGFELVVGSRYIPGGSIPSWKRSRRLLSRGGNWYASSLLGLGVTNSTSGFRFYTSSLLDGIDLDDVRAERYGFQIEMTYRSVQAHAHAIEVPIRLMDRIGGESKMSTALVIEALGLVTLLGMERVLRGNVPEPVTVEV